MWAGSVSIIGNRPSLLNVVAENWSRRYCFNRGTFSSVGSYGSVVGLVGSRGSLSESTADTESGWFIGKGNVVGRMFSSVQALRLK